MKTPMIGLCVLLVGAQGALAQEKAAPPAATPNNEEQAVLNLSKDKWRWMSERNVDALAALFHEKAVFVHMGGTMSRQQELDVIKGGGIQYKHAEVLDASVQLICRR